MGLYAPLYFFVFIDIHYLFGNQQKVLINKKGVNISPKTKYRNERIDVLAKIVDLENYIILMKNVNKIPSILMIHG